MKNLIALFFLVFSLHIVAQETIATNEIGFALKDGIFRNQEEFFKNQPGISFTKVRTKDGKKALDIDLVNNQYYIIQGKELKQLELDSIFGFSQNGTFFLRFNFRKEDYFGRSVNPGELWQFAALVVTYNTSMSFDPYYRSMQQQNPTASLMQIVFDFENNRLLPVDHKVLLPRLASDEDILKLMEESSKGKRKKKLFLYLRKYNQKNPLYFPK